MTAWLRLPIFVAALVPALFLAGFLGQSVVRAAALVPDAKGQKPQVKSKMVYGRETMTWKSRRISAPPGGRWAGTTPPTKSVTGCKSRAAA